MRFTPVFLLLLLAVNASAQRQAYYLATNWSPVVQQQGTNTVTNMVGRIDAEPVPPSMLQPPAAPLAAAPTTPEPDSDLGAIVTTIITLVGYILAAWAKWQERRKAKLSRVLGQNIETSLEVIEGQPNGKALASKLKDEMKSQQVDAGVKRMATEVHDEQINTMEAKESAERVMKA